MKLLKSYPELTENEEDLRMSFLDEIWFYLFYP